MSEHAEALAQRVVESMHCSPNTLYLRILGARYGRGPRHAEPFSDSDLSYLGHHSDIDDAQRRKHHPTL